MEVWKDIEGFKGIYQISSDGKVRRKIGYGCRSERILKNQPIKGYERAVLHTKGHRTQFLVHRLVAGAFIPNPENKPEVNHKNGIKTDNRAENLEWVTSSENKIHGFRNGLYTPKRGRENPMYGKPGRINHFRLVVCRTTGTVYQSVSDAARKLNMKRTTLVAMLSGQNKNTTTLRYAMPDWAKEQGFSRSRLKTEA